MQYNSRKKLQSIKKQGTAEIVRTDDFSHTLFFIIVEKFLRMGRDFLRQSQEGTFSKKLLTPSNSR
jgi:hypothetical protein